MYISAKTKLLVWGDEQCVCFQNKIAYILDTLIKKKYFLDNKSEYFFGCDKTDISATKEALAMNPHL